VADYRSYVDGLDEVSLASLNVLVEAGVDLSQAEDEEGPLALPGAPLFALAAAAQRPLEEVGSAVQNSYDATVGQAEQQA